MAIKFIILAFIDLIGNNTSSWKANNQAILGSLFISSALHNVRPYKPLVASYRMTYCHLSVLWGFRFDIHNICSAAAHTYRKNVVARIDPPPTLGSVLERMVRDNFD